ncbi:MAG: hypothetical protein ACW981_08795 [Candidatus Hodarchaeales archaeon]|jgi:rRNA processing protein Gar1
MSSSQIKELGLLKTRAKDKLLFNHDAHNIPPLGVRVGFFDESEKKTKIILIGKIVDIIGQVKNPTVVVKIDKGSEEYTYPEKTIFYYQKDRKKKNFRRKGIKGKKRA